MFEISHMKLRVVAGISSIEFDYRLGGVRAVSHPAARSWWGEGGHADDRGL